MDYVPSWPIGVQFSSFQHPLAQISMGYVAMSDFLFFSSLDCLQLTCFNVVTIHGLRIGYG